MLRPASQLTYDDAPWMSAGMHERPGFLFMHEKLDNTLGEKFGAQSLRQLLLLQEKLQETFPVPSAERVRHAVAEQGHPVQACPLIDVSARQPSCHSHPTDPLYLCVLR